MQFREGYAWGVRSDVHQPVSVESSTPFLTPPDIPWLYRQRTARRLVDKGEELLLKSMWDLHDQGKIQVTDAIMEEIPPSRTGIFPQASFDSMSRLLTLCGCVSSSALPSKRTS
jgi:hypothetical protein